MVRGESLEGVKDELDRLVHRMLDDALVKRRPATRVNGRAPRATVALRLRYWGLLLAGRLGLRRDALREGMELRRSSRSVRRGPGRA